MKLRQATMFGESYNWGEVADEYLNQPHVLLRVFRRYLAPQTARLDGRSRRFMMQLLPGNLDRICRFGFMANRPRSRNLQRCRPFYEAQTTAGTSQMHCEAAIDRAAII